jgi:hypothetical protein
LNAGSRAGALIGIVFAIAACEYVVVPPEEGAPAGATSKGWTAVATSLSSAADGDLRIELTIHNQTGQWSAMTASGAGTLSKADGSSSACPTVFVGTGGHRLAPGMRMRGYVGGSKSEPTTELIRVECDVADAGAGATLAIDYSYVTGEYNYYDPDAGQASARLEVNLDEVATDLTYPIAEAVDGVVQPGDVEITAINDVALRLAGVERTEAGLEFTWETSNPGEYPTFVHIGRPPVIGVDGIVYGWYESPDLESVPATPAGEKAEWTTVTSVPDDVSGLFALLSVESKKQRLFVNYALELGDV